MKAEQTFWYPSMIWEPFVAEEEGRATQVETTYHRCYDERADNDNHKDGD